MAEMCPIPVHFSAAFAPCHREVTQVPLPLYITEQCRGEPSPKYALFLTSTASPKSLPVIHRVYTYLQAALQPWSDCAHEPIFQHALATTAPLFGGQAARAAAIFCRVHRRHDIKIVAQNQPARTAISAWRAIGGDLLSNWVSDRRPDRCDAGSGRRSAN